MDINPPDTIGVAAIKLLGKLAHFLYRLACSVAGSITLLVLLQLPPFTNLLFIEDFILNALGLVFIQVLVSMSLWSEETFFTVKKAMMIGAASLCVAGAILTSGHPIANETAPLALIANMLCIFFLNRDVGIFRIVKRTLYPDSRFTYRRTNDSPSAVNLASILDRIKGSIWYVGLILERGLNPKKGTV